MMITQSRRKGQYLVIQEVLVYGMGLLMLIGVLSTFTYMKNTIQESLRENQLEVVSNTVANGIQSVYSLDEPSRIAIDIPQKILDKQYTITTALVGSLYILSVTDGQFTHKQLLEVAVEDAVIRGNDRLEIIKDNGKIQLRGVSHS